ncbi:hypothetical protein Lfu02_04460 [Longispora fulva]|uniref:Uncharacterized protein YkwD n=1 Tax=Longispora fulva TaxID=619741 RepID=A0A8J7KNX8_9ACTN|nr:CAP domain-containing protein [Longispora fulva]MBG6135687.1 uncharacterized protein YkwD [Longispora fulva]GIG56074.1 hypothetical protein Lfu02_04460 [Longispora fulva]
MSHPTARRAVLALAAATVTAAGLTALSAAPAQADVTEQMITIQDHQNHHSLATANDEGSRIVARGYQDDSTRYWISNKPGGRVDFTRNVNGTERVVEMDTRDGRTTQFIHWWAGDNQQWTLENASEGGTYLHDALDNRCLTYHGLDREVTVENCDGSMSQRFDLSGGGSTTPPPATGDEARFVQLLNDLRASRGKAPVRVNAKLTRAANCNAVRMSQQHVSGHFCDMGTEARNAGYAFRALGEIAFYGPTNVDDAFRGWVNSPHHYDIMVGDYTEVGLSRVGGNSWNADFGTPQ